jgi:hypothetical protein
MPGRLWCLSHTAFHRVRHGQCDQRGAHAGLHVARLGRQSRRSYQNKKDRRGSVPPAKHSIGTMSQWWTGSATSRSLAPHSIEVSMSGCTDRTRWRSGHPSCGFSTDASAHYGACRGGSSLHAAKPVCAPPKVNTSQSPATDVPLHLGIYDIPRNSLCRKPRARAGFTCASNNRGGIVSWEKYPCLACVSAL